MLITNMLKVSGGFQNTKLSQESWSIRTCRVIHYYWQMYLKTFVTNPLKYVNLLCIRFVSTCIIMASMSEENKSNIGITDRRWYDINDGGRYQRYNVLCHTLVCKSQQKELHEIHSNLKFLPKRSRIDKSEKLTCNLFHKKNYVIHIKALKQALNYRVILKKVHRVIEFKQAETLHRYEHRTENKS